MITYTHKEVEALKAKTNKTKEPSIVLKLISTTVIAIVLVLAYLFILANIFFSGILTKSFILSLVALPFLIWATIKLNKKF